MDYVTPEYAVGIAQVLSAEVHWNISASSWDLINWDPVFEEDDIEASSNLAMRAHYEGSDMPSNALMDDRGKLFAAPSIRLLSDPCTGVTAAMDRHGCHASCRGVGSILVRGSSRDLAPSTITSSARCKSGSTEMYKDGHGVCSLVQSSAPCKAEALFDWPPRKTARVSFSSSVQFWFPGPGQLTFLHCEPSRPHNQQIGTAASVQAAHVVPPVCGEADKDALMGLLELPCTVCDSVPLQPSDSPWETVLSDTDRDLTSTAVWSADHSGLSALSMNQSACPGHECVLREITNTMNFSAMHSSLAVRVCF